MSMTRVTRFGQKRIIQSIVFSLIGMGLLASLLLLRGHRTAAITVIILAFLHGALNLLWRGYRTAFSRFSVAMIRLIGTIISAVVLGLFYFTVFSVFSLLWKLFRKDELIRNGGWQVIDSRENDPSRLEKLY